MIEDEIAHFGHERVKSSKVNSISPDPEEQVGCQYWIKALHSFATPLKAPLRAWIGLLLSAVSPSTATLL